MSHRRPRKFLNKKSINIWKGNLAFINIYRGQVQNIHLQ